MVVIAAAVVVLVPSGRAETIPGCEAHLKYGMPGLDGRRLCRSGYALAFDTTRKVAAWVAYHLTAAKVNGPFPRSDDFRDDDDLLPGERSELVDYDEPVYQRGHLAPAEAMAWSELSMSESFLMSNMAPQIGNGFNNGIWRSLENRVRTWTAIRGELYVVTGPIYSPAPIETIGPNQVAVPSHFYKVLFDPVRVQAIAFILPNAANPTSDLPTFIRSVDAVEEATGLDFLFMLDDGVELLVEDAPAEGLWALN